MNDPVRVFGFRRMRKLGPNHSTSKDVIGCFILELLLRPITLSWCLNMAFIFSLPFILSNTAINTYSVIPDVNIR